MWTSTIAEDQCRNEDSLRDCQGGSSSTPRSETLKQSLGVLLNGMWRIEELTQCFTFD